MRRGYARFLGRRLSAAVLLALGATLVAFLLVQVVPADPVTANLSDQALGDPSAIAAFRKTWGLDQPLPVQYLDYLKNLAHGNLGTSEQTHRPVLKDLEQFVPATFELAIPAMLLAAIVGITLGTFAAVQRGKPSDQLVRVVSLLGLSTPPFWLAILALYVFFFKLGWFPSGDRLSPIDIPPPEDNRALHARRDACMANGASRCDAARHLVLPVCVLAAYIVGLLTRFTRSAVLEVLENDYVRTARAKGLPTARRALRHTLAGGARARDYRHRARLRQPAVRTVLVESIFSWPGVGQYAYRSAVALDLRAIMGVSLSSRSSTYRQPGRRRALRRHRSEDPHHVSAAAASIATRRRLRSASVRRCRLAAAGRDGGRRRRRRVDRRRHLRASCRSYDPDKPVSTSMYVPPSAHHLFGTDDLGRDILSRVHLRRTHLHSARARDRDARAPPRRHARCARGVLRRQGRRAVMRVVDLVFAFPTIILAMAVAAAFGPSLRNAVLALVLVVVAVVCTRPSRRGLDGPTRGLRQRIAAARCFGARRARPRRASEHLRPRVRARHARARQCGASALCALVPRPRAAPSDSGVGLDGRLRRAELHPLVDRHVPGLAIMTAVLGFNFLGDSLRDRLDPRLSKQIRE